MDSNQAIESSTFFLQANDNLGALEISTFIGVGLFGVFMAQVYHYFNKSGGDRSFLKMLVRLLNPWEIHTFMRFNCGQVAFLTFVSHLCRLYTTITPTAYHRFLEACHTLTSVVAIYHATITDWMVAKPNSYPVALTIVLESLITLLVQVRHTISTFSFPWALKPWTHVSVQFSGVLFISHLYFQPTPTPGRGLLSAFIRSLRWRLFYFHLCLYGRPKDAKRFICPHLSNPHYERNDCWRCGGSLNCGVVNLLSQENDSYSCHKAVSKILLIHISLDWGWLTPFWFW